MSSTTADLAYSLFANQIKTISLVTICKRLGAIKQDSWRSNRLYTFPDNSALFVTGRGRNHTVEIKQSPTTSN